MLFLPLIVKRGKRQLQNQPRGEHPSEKHADVSQLNRLHHTRNHIDGTPKNPADRTTDWILEVRDDEEKNEDSDRVPEELEGHDACRHEP